MTRPRMIRLEKNPSGVTITCASCTWWSAFRATMSEAHTGASDHERRVHPGDYRARNAAKMYEARHAVKPVNV